MPSERPEEPTSSRSSRSRSGQVDPAKVVSDATKTVRRATAPIVDAGVIALGGSEGMNKTLKDWNPTVYAYIKDTYSTTDPAKQLFMMIPIMMLSSLLSILGPPIAMLSSIASAHFMLITGNNTLSSSFSFALPSSRILSLTSCLTLFLVIGVLQMLPAFVLDVQYHFTAMWTLILPVILTTRYPGGKGENVAEVISKRFLKPAYTALKEFLPQALVKPGKGPEMAEVLIYGGIVVLLLHVGIIGGGAGYLLIWTFAAKATLKTLSESKDENPLVETEQIDLLAFWVLTWLASLVETLPFLSDSLKYHLPSYFMWKTIAMAVMMALRSNEKGRQAFYTEVCFKPAKSSRSSSSSNSEQRQSSRS